MFTAYGPNVLIKYKSQMLIPAYICKSYLRVYVTFGIKYITNQLYR